MQTESKMLHLNNIYLQKDSKVYQKIFHFPLQYFYGYYYARLEELHSCGLVKLPEMTK